MNAVKSFPDVDDNDDSGDDDDDDGDGDYDDGDDDDGDGMRGHSEAFIPLACCPL